MAQIVISVSALQNGWQVRQEPDGPPLVFFSGGQAESTAQRLGAAAWMNGIPAEVVIHDRQGQFVGGWTYGEGAPAPSATAFA